MGNERLRSYFNATTSTYDAVFAAEPENASQKVFPIKLTALKCTAQSPSLLHRALCLLIDPTNLFDIVDYWNLRAAGVSILPLPTNRYRDFERSVADFASRSRFPINERVMNHPQIVKARSVPDELLEQAGEWVTSLGIRDLVRQGWFPRYGDRGYRIVPELSLSPIESRTSSHVVLTNNGYGHFQPQPPDCAWVGDERFQHWAAELKFFAGPELCYRLPQRGQHCDALANHAVGQGFDLATSRVSRGGIVAITSGERGDVSIHPVNSEDAFRAIFEDSHLKLGEKSAPGLAVDRVIENFGDIHDCQVLQNREVRSLVARLANGSSILSHEAKGMLYRSFQDSTDRPARVAAILDFLTVKRVLRLGLEFQCVQCRRRSWYPAKYLDERFTCRFCFAEQETPRLDEIAWRYTSDGLFRLENKMDGAITVLLALHFIWVCLGAEIYRLSSFTYEDNTTMQEVDFAVLSAQFSSDETHLILGEAKSAGTLSEEEKTKLRTLGSKTGCILAFCTLAIEFSEDDKVFFRELAANGQQLILLPGPKLELDYMGIHDFISCHHIPLSKAATLARVSTVDVLGPEFAAEQGIGL